MKLFQSYCSLVAKDPRWVPKDPRWVLVLFSSKKAPFSSLKLYRGQSKSSSVLWWKKTDGNTTIVVEELGFGGTI